MVGSMSESQIIKQRWPSLRFYREMQYDRETISQMQLAWAEILGFTRDSDKVCRVWYLMHDRRADGQGEFTPDQYGGRPVNPLSIECGKRSCPMDTTFVVSPRCAADEKVNHENVRDYWQAWADHHSGKRVQPKTMPLWRRLFA